jgi:ribose 5-phosphate isomerase B
MKIFLACDHAGYNLKQEILIFLQQNNFITTDLGCNNANISVDYPDFAHKLAEKLTNNQDFGILICGSGIGISISANRHQHIRAALCHNANLAKLARAHNNANVLCLGARIIKSKTAINIVKNFLQQPFEAGRHVVRINKINNR